GDNSALPAGVTLDLAGAPRRWDDPATPDTGAGSSPVVDMGAFEFGAPTPTPSPWLDLGGGLAGTIGVPVLTGDGPLTGGSVATITLSGASPSAAVAVVLGPAEVNLTFLGGTLVPAPSVLLFGLVTNP